MGNILEDGGLILPISDFLLDEGSHLRFFGAFKHRALIQRRYTSATSAHHLVTHRFDGWFAALGPARQHGKQKDGKPEETVTSDK